ncbi:MAG: PAS domain S-box protein [Endomicrobium sp.]|jgi:PAS domain S-box-containing protein|nr:PAS domain S-box protein [Endomicrobium sp.]
MLSKFLSENYQYMTFFSAWAYLLFAVACFLSWRIKLVKLSYFWFMIFALSASLMRFGETFFSGYFNDAQYDMLHGVFLYVSSIVLFISGQRSYLKFFPDKTYVNYLIIPAVLIPLPFLFYNTTFFCFSVSAFLFLPGSLILAAAVFKRAQNEVYMRRTAFATFIFSVLYMIIFFFSEVSTIAFPVSDFMLERSAIRFFGIICIFFCGGFIFQYFKIIYEKQEKYYEYVPEHWKRIPITALLFLVLSASIFLPNYLEQEAVNAIKQDAAAEVEKVSQRIRAKIINADKLCKSLSISPFIAGLLSSSSAMQDLRAYDVVNKDVEIFGVKRMYVLNERGDIVYRAGISGAKADGEINFKKSAYFAQAKTQGSSKAFVKNLFGGYENYVFMIAIADKNGKFKGVVAVVEGIDEIEEQLDERANMYLVDNNGVIFMSSGNSGGYFNNILEIPESFPDISSENLDAGVITVNNEKFYSVRSFVNEDGWSVIYFKSLKNARYFRNIGFVSASLFVIVLILLYYLITQSTRTMALALRHKAIINAANAMMIIATDISGAIIIYSPGAREILGYDIFEIEKAGFENVFSDKHGNSLGFRDIIALSVNPNNQLQCKTKSGVLKTLFVSIVPQFSTNNKLIGYIFSGVDISEELKMQAERDALHMHLIQQNKLASLGELAGSIAHELNNPLSIIVGYSQRLLKDFALASFSESEKSVRNIFEAAERSKNIVANMLEFSRAGTSKMQAVNLNHVVESTMLIIEKEMYKSLIVIEKSFCPDMKLILGNAMQLQQVILNIIINAKDAMAGKGKLSITTSVADGKAVLNISDTGAGISAENISKIFDPFFTTKAAGKGTGLGLSISYGIIKAHGGTISVESELGKGTVFTITFNLL